MTKKMLLMWLLFTLILGTVSGIPSSNQRERVEAGVRDRRIVQLTRSSTPFPKESHGGWNGDFYLIVGDGVTMYRSKRVPPPLRYQLGPGKISFKGLYARIQFNEHNGNLAKYFQGY